MSDKQFDEDVLLDHEQAPQSSSADLIVPEVPTLLDDLKTEECISDEIFSSIEELHEHKEEEAVVQSPPSSQVNVAACVVNEPPCTAVVEYPVLSKQPHATVTRLVIVSWKIRQFTILSKALKSSVLMFQYKSDSNLQSILSQARDLLKGEKVISLAFVCHGNPGTLTVCTDQVLSSKTVTEHNDVKQFFVDAVTEFVDQCNPNCHLDFLATSLLLSSDGQVVIQTLQDYLRIPITASKDILGTDNKRRENDIGNTGELYFNASTLRTWSGSVGQSISNYEKIRTLGRGAYGTAVLYRKKDDDSLVVLKEISILDLSAVERQAAMNEVKVLGMLSHPNIVSYYDSFDEDGILWIEMEYADGGTLSDYLGKQESDLEERDILIMFSQMLSAIKYCHHHNILHRDLKTQNIFLTQEFKVKLGDFGIAKIMNTTTSGNFSVVGTPYYISPEMCEGKRYDSKSDIWALGCVLYEMANLTRTFDGTNLPALINKIVKGTFAPVKEIYSAEFRLLVRDLLQKDPACRPTAEDILYSRMQELLQRYDNFDSEEDTKTLLHYGRTRSLLYFCDVSSMQLYPIQGLPAKILVSEVSVGLAHIVVVSVERGVFTWGDNSFGQLGLGDTEARDEPTEVVLLRGKSIIQAFCGDYFTLFLSDNGLVLSCGQANHGALGHGEWEVLTRPKLIDELIMLDITSLSTGCHHVAASTGEGAAYTWGFGEDGRLGHGNEDSICIPTKVDFIDGNVFIQHVQCSDNGTVFIADTGTVFACGRNTGNKLGLNPRQGFLLQFRSRSSKNTVECAKVPTLVKDLCKYQLLDMKFGMSHFTMINHAGKIYSSGNNNEGQLGCGNTKPHEAVTIVKGFEEDQVSMIACGSTFSFAAIQQLVGKNTVNSIYFWGTKPQARRKRQISANDSLLVKSASIGRNHVLSVNEEDSGISDVDVTSSRSASEREGRKSLSSLSRRIVVEPRKSVGSTPSESLANSVFQDFVDDESDNIRQTYLTSILKGTNAQTLNLVSKENPAVVFPQLTFKFQSVGNIEGCDDGEEYPVMLQDMKCFQNHVIFHLETTAPPPKKRKIAKKLDSSFSSVTSTKGESSENSEADTSGEVPTWIRKELEHGIPLSSESASNVSPLSEDEKSKSMHGDDSNVIPILKKRRSLESLNHRSNTFNSQRRDPNFNLIPKIQRQVTLLKLTEKKTKATCENTPLTETQIIDGVAVSKSIAEVQNQLSPCFSDQSMDEDKVKGVDVNPSNNVEVIKVKEVKVEEVEAIKSCDIQPPPPCTSVSPDIATSRIPKLKGKLPPDPTSIPIEITPMEVHSKKNSPSKSKLDSKATKESQKQLSKARLKRNMKVDAMHKPKTSSTTKDKGRNRDVDERLSSASDADDPRERRRVKERKKEEEKSALEEEQRLAKISEEKLLEEIRELKEEKIQREARLGEIHVQKLRESEEKSRHEIEGAKKREEMLNDEILALKTNLNNQNSKLQDNYNILLSLQEQLLRMQQHQLRESPQPLARTPQPPLPVQHKSKVCSLM